MRQGRNRYRVAGTSHSGRGYQDIVLGDSEADAREGALRERGFQYVTCVSLLGPTEAQMIDQLNADRESAMEEGWDPDDYQE